MTVNPGFGGQSFIHETLPKIQQAYEWRHEKSLGFNIGVDGGIDLKTSIECAVSGADAFISGTALLQPAEHGRCDSQDAESNRPRGGGKWQAWVRILKGRRCQASFDTRAPQASAGLPPRAPVRRAWRP